MLFDAGAARIHPWIASLSMPGYKALSSEFNGSAAEHVRYAEALQRAGDPQSAAVLLEQTLESLAITSRELPGWLCGRLAALYRSLKRYDDEVRVLERYRESQLSEEARTRFDARLSKAYAIADRKQRTENRALSSVRGVINRRSEHLVSDSLAVRNPESAYSRETMTALRAAWLSTSTGAPGHLPAMRSALTRLRAESRENEYPVERLVDAIKALWRSTPRADDVSLDYWEGIYRSTLTRSLALFFDEPDQ